MRRRSKVGMTAVILVGIYVLGLICGLYAISYMPGEWKRDNLEYYAGQRIVEYKSSGRVDNWSNGGMAVVIYNSNAKFQDFFRMNGDPFSINFVDQTEDALHEVLSGGKTLQLFPFVRNYSKLGYTSFLYVGLPMMTDGEITGAFFWVKELPDLVETMIGYIFVFSLFFVVLVLFLLHNSHMQRRFDAALRRYVDNITHEMKSPVASIKALTEALTDGMERDENERSVYYGMIIGEANRQEHMILDVLTLAKLQTRRVRTNRWDVPAGEIFDPVCEKQETLCELSDISFSVADEIRQLPELHTNPDMIRSVLETLLSNARKFVQEGGTISLTAEIQRGRVIICVADNGVGIPESEQPNVFKRFYKGSQNCNDTGSGLGLAIANETITALKEKIWLRSAPGEGTSIFFTITRA